MLSYKTKDGKVIELEAQGSLAELLSDTTFLAHAIYGMLARSNEGLAKAFRAHFALLAADPESPMRENSNPNCISIVQRVKPKEGKSDDK